jgi:hypothetical protein
METTDTQKETKHTKGEWRVGLGDLTSIWVGDGGNKIADCSCWGKSIEENRANAKLIVKAVNSHYGLIEALENATLKIRNFLPQLNRMGCYTYPLAEVINDIEQALKKAKDEQ